MKDYIVIKSWKVRAESMDKASLLTKEELPNATSTADITDLEHKPSLQDFYRKCRGEDFLDLALNRL